MTYAPGWDCDMRCVRSSAHLRLRTRAHKLVFTPSEGDMRMMLLLWDATSLKIVEIPIKTTLNNPDFPEK